jgi:hypothetical protein
MPTVEPCPGSCNTRYREAREAYGQALAAYERDGILDPGQSRPEPPLIQPVYGDPAWCGRCAAQIRVTLAELDELAALLAATADGHRASSDSAERVSSTPEAISPSGAADELKDLMAMLSGWEAAYREHMQWPGAARRGFLASVSTSCIAWLVHHLDGILSSPIAADFGAEVMQWHRDFRRSAKAGVRKLRKPMRCPGCRLLTLTWEEGDDRVECANPDCYRVLSYADYENEVAAQAEAITPGGQGSEPLAS